MASRDTFGGTSSRGPGLIDRRGGGISSICRAGKAALVLALALSACASNKPYQIDLMPAPDLYEEGKLDPFSAGENIFEEMSGGVLYATTRPPATEGDRERFYRNARGGIVRLGEAHIQLSAGELDWEEARRVSLLKNRTAKYPLKVADVEEFGILDDTITPFTDPAFLQDDFRAPSRDFAAEVNARLARSRKKDVFVYTHGFKVVFDNPILVAAELWHFLGYEGAFIAYAWPSTPKNRAYFGDVETAAGEARDLRIFLRYLAEETDAERIHLVAYSAGTRLVARALEQIALKHHDRDVAEIRDEFRIGHVILVGSDIDRQVFATYLSDGLLRVLEHLSVYVSGTDKALGMSRWIYQRERLGQMWAADALHANAAEFLATTDNLSVINVTEASGAATGNGHAYFRKSPWASSDILVTLMYGLRPEERGLVLSQDSTMWTFPSDYVERLRAVVLENYEKLAAVPETSVRAH